MTSLHPRRFFRDVPWCTVSLTLAAVAVFFIPGATHALAFDKDAILKGELWRFITGHLTHWSMEHLFWDVLALLVLGIIVECRSRASLLACIIGSALAISSEVWLFESNVTSYRGLSGIDSGLFALAACIILREGITGRNWWRATLAGAGLGAFAIKTVLELWLGHPLFVDSSASGFVPMPAAHIVGGLVGAAVVAAPALAPKHTKCLHRPTQQPNVQLATESD